MDREPATRSCRLPGGPGPMKTVGRTNHQRDGTGRVDSGSNERPAKRDDARRSDGGRVSQARPGGRHGYIVVGAVSAGRESAVSIGAMKLDLNSDLGEGEPLSRTRALMRWITSANVACGGHAGDLRTMETCVRLAKRLG